MSLSNGMECNYIVNFQCCNEMKFRVCSLAHSFGGYKAMQKLWDGTQMRVLEQAHEQVNLHNPNKLINTSWNQVMLWFNDMQLKLIWFTWLGPLGGGIFFFSIIYFMIYNEK